MRDDWMAPVQIPYLRRTCRIVCPSFGLKLCSKSSLIRLTVAQLSAASSQLGRNHWTSHS